MNEVWSGTIVLFIFSAFLYFVQGDRDYTARQQAIDNVTYKYTQMASKKGEMSEVLYEKLEETLAIYGDFEIKLKAEKEANGSIMSLHDDQVVDYDLRENEYDAITIYVTSKKEHYLSKILELPPWNIDSTHKITSQSSAYIQ